MSSSIICYNVSSTQHCYDTMDMELCQSYSYSRWYLDFYITSIGASLVIFLGILGNAGTLFTLSGRRLTTATFVYYRAIACVDLFRCIFVFTYVLRVLIPFRKYYWTSWYEAHFMYFIIGTFGFVSTTLAVFLCFRLCYCIVQSRRLKKIQTRASETKRIIYGVSVGSILINVWVCFEWDVHLTVGDECSFGMELEKGNESISINKIGWWNGIIERTYALGPSQFSRVYSSLLKAIHNLPSILLLILFLSTLILLLLCVIGFSSTNHHEVLKNSDSSDGNTKAVRTQRQLCRLFLFLSISYTFGLLPSLIYEFFFNSGLYFTNTQSSLIKDTNNSNISSNFSYEESYFEFESEYSYEKLLSIRNRREILASILNVIQNLAHAVSFYVYLFCSEEFRNEFINKIRRMRKNLHHAYSTVGFSRFSTRRSLPSTEKQSPPQIRSALKMRGNECKVELVNRKWTGENMNLEQTRKRGTPRRRKILLSENDDTDGNKIKGQIRRKIQESTKNMEKRSTKNLNRPEIKKETVTGKYGYWSTI